ncbi:hypothetical protein Q777_GL001589 [Lacticaseibacillus rhamnosus DSM 20021 = JCM 1136 = NBRC 3425]|nr:hypothetical protein Q777_GL001589 [Lacticaseibacillus rhamnosus DSM 20021 = JCM 1136 = NBRC 3425]CAR90729.1 Putative protein without homology [Lacticaseibacillus rhamnosus Lc 705]
MKLIAKYTFIRHQNSSLHAGFAAGKRVVMNAGKWSFMLTDAHKRSSLAKL